MKFKIVILSMLLVFVQSIHSRGQTPVNDGKKAKSSVIETEYNRIALTMILVNNPNSGHSQKLRTVFPSMAVPNKFDDNTLSIQIISSDEIKSDLNQAFSDKKIGNKIIAKWYNRQPDGSFNMDVISKRGLYNATDQDVLTATAKKIGQAALKDAGEKLLAKSYILVFDFPGLQTSEEYYNANNVASDKRDMHGWRGSYSAQLYRLNLDEAGLAGFYNDLWINKEDDSKTKAERAAKFDAANFPITFVSSVSGVIFSEQPKPGTQLAKLTLIKKSDDQLFQEFVEKGIEKAEYGITSKLEDFKVKTSVYGTNPISAKIGLKEGLEVDYRFFVYEQEQGNDGSIKSVRKAVIRANNHIASNLSVSTGSSNSLSQFYQIGGKEVEQGMVLRQMNDKGIGLYANYGTGSVGGVEIGAEYMVSKLLAKYIGFSPTSLKLFGEYGMESKVYSSQSSKSIDFTRFNVGVSKSIYFAKNFQLEPFFAYGSEKATLEGEEGNVRFLKYGVKFGANIAYNLQFVVGLNNYDFLSGITDKEGNKIVDSGTWDENFNGRKGISFDFGLRFQF